MPAGPTLFLGEGLDRLEHLRTPQLRVYHALKALDQHLRRRREESGIRQAGGRQDDARHQQQPLATHSPRELHQPAPDAAARRLAAACGGSGALTLMTPW